MQFVAVKRAGRAGGDRRAVTPGGVRVAVALALRATLVEVLLAVGVGGHVGSVDGDGLAQFGELLVQGGGHAVHADVQQRLELPQLGGEPVASVDTRHAGRAGAAERRAEGGVPGDQGNRARPRRQGVEALGERHANHHANRVARAASPARGRKLADELGDLGAVEQLGKLYGVRAPWYGRIGHGGYVSLVLTPGGANLAGVTLVGDIDCSWGV
jgi:hypothetical protein